MILKLLVTTYALYYEIQQCAEMRVLIVTYAILFCSETLCSDAIKSVNKDFYPNASGTTDSNCK